MSRWNGIGILLGGAVVVFLLAMVVGQLLGQPVLLGFVTTDSMQPALGAGDGFVAVPSAIAGDVEEGDVVTFRAKEIQGGGLTTHRVVEATERGYVTKGDDNPFTDQDGGEPPVKPVQIVAVAWQPGGSTLAIPGVGTAVTGVKGVLTAIQRHLATLLGTGAILGSQGLAYLLLALSVIAYVGDRLWKRNRKYRNRDASRESGTSVRLLMGVLAGTVIIAATAAMVAPAGPQEFGIVSAESDSPGLGVIAAGTNESTTYTLGNRGFLPVVTYFEPTTAGVDVQPRENVIPGRSTVNTTLTLVAPPENGYYRRYVVEHRYLLVLPQSTIRWLYHAHPWLPVVVIDALLGVSFYVLGVALAGTGRLRSRSRDSGLRPVTVLRRALGDRY